MASCGCGRRAHPAFSWPRSQVHRGRLECRLSGDRKLVASGSFDGTLRLWDAASGAWLRTLRVDRRYERLDITGMTGVSDAQREALLALGAIERT